MKNLTAIIALSLFCCSSLTIKAQVITYSGPVEFEMEMIKSADGGGKDGNFNWGVSVDEKRIIKATIYAIFTAGPGLPSTGTGMYQLTGIQENIQLTASAENHGFEEKISQTCAGEDNKPKDSWGKPNTYTVSPGDSETREFTANTTRTDPSKQVIERGLIGMQGDKYSIILHGKMKVSVTSTSHNITRFPCLQTNPPSEPLNTTTELEWPIAIGAEGRLTNPDYLEGFHVAEDVSSDDCRHCIGSLSNLVHGDVSCSYTSKVTTTWMLVKRTDECDANVTYIKGDVKINGVPAKERAIKIGAGDLIETGVKSGIEIRMPDNSAYRMGSKSKLTMVDPCNLKPRDISDPHQAGLTFLRGRIYAVVHTVVGNEAGIILLNTASGVRGGITPELPLFYASSDPDFVPFLFQQDIPLPGYATAHQENPEKDELIEGYQSLPDDKTAYYLDFEDGKVLELTALKGTIRVEDDMGFRSMDIPEGTTVNQWNDGTAMTEITILTK
ncbi:MAG: hypothetical protein RQ743_03580 [Bacteroidales bacterium]|nr:hypothetical protein [Bacteroidales bacterium]